MSATAIDPARARATARHILDGRRYKGSPVPRPLHGILSWIGDRVSPITHWIGDRFSWLPNWSQPWVEGIAIAAVVAVVVYLVATGVRARTHASRLASDAQPTARVRGESPAELEAAAAEAEARGDHALAVRLRFRAGLLRLDRDAHAIAYRPSIPTAEVRAELHSPAFDALADRFERITYGGADAEPTDTDGARREWPDVVSSARKP
ncbi:MAG TPA: hypothetical protein VH914_21100 [Acidimicrobiia bacterium]|nr:hypothetical protein [Acidimicrobiia bacterium]